MLNKTLEVQRNNCVIGYQEIWLHLQTAVKNKAQNLKNMEYPEWECYFCFLIPQMYLIPPALN